MSDMNTSVKGSDQLTSLPEAMRVAVFGSSGGIGAALTERLIAHPRVAKVEGFSRRHPDPSRRFDFRDEASIARIGELLADQAPPTPKAPLNMVIVATGLLHDQNQHISPEKSLKQLSHEGMSAAFLVNTIGPALIGKYTLPLLAKEGKTVFAAISARVGSISDNQLGGWHSYRAAKAALNMMIKGFALEMKRKNPETAVIGLHPGTTDTGLSAPFQSGLRHTLFTPDEAAGHLLAVIDGVNPDHTGCVMAWDGQIIPA
jgi:NAD(P)-dependent dehydrogenase (short-subunit alcohol dehydrogenase family)